MSRTDLQYQNLMEDTRNATFQGRSYDYNDRVTVPGSSSVYFAITTGLPTLLISDARFTSKADDMELSVYEAGEYSGGVPIILNNLNRNFRDRPIEITDIKAGVSVVSLGNRISFNTLLSGGGRVASPGTASISYPLVLRSNEVYIVEFKNLDTVSRDVTTLLIVQELTKSSL